jgi:hypothetical protein
LPQKKRKETKFPTIDFLFYVLDGIQVKGKEFNGMDVDAKKIRESLRWDALLRYFPVFRLTFPLETAK